MSQRTDVDRLTDMRSALADIRRLTGSDRATFEADRVAQQAVAYNLAVLGEAARALSPEVRDRYPEVPWRDVIAQRNVVVHEYPASTSRGFGPLHERTSRDSLIGSSLSRR